MKKIETLLIVTVALIIETLLIVTVALILVGCDIPDANFTPSGNATIVKVEKYGNDPERAVFTIDTGIDGYARNVRVLLPVKTGRVGDVLSSVMFQSPKVKAEDEK